LGALKLKMFLSDNLFNNFLNNLSRFVSQQHRTHFKKESQKFADTQMCNSNYMERLPVFLNLIGDNISLLVSKERKSRSLQS